MAQAQGGGFDWRTLVSAISSALPVYQQQRASARQQADLEAGQLAARQKQFQADQQIGDTVSKVARSGPTVPLQQSLASYTSALQRMRTAPSSSIADVGSSRYKAGVENAATTVKNYGARQSFDLAQIDAAARQRESEANDRASLGSNLKTLADAGDTDLYLAKLKAAREQPNPWITLLAQLGGRIGRNYMTKNERLQQRYGTTLPSIGELSDFMPDTGNGSPVEVA